MVFGDVYMVLAIFLYTLSQWCTMYLWTVPHVTPLMYSLATKHGLCWAILVTPRRWTWQNAVVAALSLCGLSVVPTWLLVFLCTTKALLSATASRLSATSLLFDKANKDVAAVCSRMVSFSVLSALVSSLVRVGNATQDTTPWSFWVVAVVMAVHGLTVASVLAWSGPTVRIAATSLVDVLLVAWSGDVHHGLVTMALVGASVLVLQSRGERKQEVCVGENLQKLREP